MTKRNKKEIKAFIDVVSLHPGNLWNEYTVAQLRTEYVINLIESIMFLAHKTASEATLVFLAAVRYLAGSYDSFIALAVNNNFPVFVKAHEAQVRAIGVLRKVQANLPERALTVMDIIAEKLPNREISVIEIGASYGAIGKCLLQGTQIIANREKYFIADQQLPSSIPVLNRYLGIEIDPPDLDWLFACVPVKDALRRLSDFLDDTRTQKNFQILEASAFGFADFPEVRALVNTDKNVVVLTSFLLYQFDPYLREKLRGEILAFTGLIKGHWINLDVDTTKENDCYLEWDGQRLIDLQDDYCARWSRL